MHGSEIDDSEQRLDLSGRASPSCAKTRCPLEIGPQISSLDALGIRASRAEGISRRRAGLPPGLRVGERQAHRACCLFDGWLKSAAIGELRVADFAPVRRS